MPITRGRKLKWTVPRTKTMIPKSSEKIQPWKAGWLARNAPGVEKTAPGGNSYGTKKGENIIVGGFTSGVAIKMVPKENE